MGTDLRISVVIPTYNRGHVVGRAIDSALAQEYRPSEIIVVDDGSVDDTSGVVDGYGGIVRRVYQPNGGVSAARNRGVSEANGEWIAFLDSDDQWLPGHLERIVRAMGATRREAALYFADTEVSAPDGGHSLWQACGFALDQPWEFRREASDWAQMRIQPMMLQASVISRTAYVELGGLPEHLRTREDTLLFFRLGLFYPACAVSGRGTLMHADGTLRLTQVYSSQTPAYWSASISLFRALLADVRHHKRESRRFVRTSLGESYFGLGRAMFRHKRYWRAVTNLAACCWVSPPAFLKELSDSLAR